MHILPIYNNSILIVIIYWYDVTFLILFLDPLKVVSLPFPVKYPTTITFMRL